MSAAETSPAEDGSVVPSPRDLLRLQALDDPQLSPDGARVAWVRTRIVASEDRYLSALLIGHVDDDAPPRLVVEQSGLARPRWSPDGRRLAFLAPDPRGVRRLWLVAPGDWVSGDGGSGDGGSGDGGSDDGAPRALADLGGSVLDFAWAPDGGALAATVRLLAPDATESAPPGVVRTSRLRWKEDGAGLVGDRWRNLVLVPIADEGADDPPPRMLLRGRFDVGAPAFSPDGTRLAFLGDLEGEGARRSCVYLLPLRTSSDNPPTPDLLATLADVRIPDLAWSPDASTIAVAGHDLTEIGHYGAQRLWLIDAATGAMRALTDEADGTIGNAAYTDTGGYGGGVGPRWLPDGDALLAPLSHGGRVRLTRFALDGSYEPVSPDDRVVAAFDVAAAGDRAALLTHGRLGPGEIEILDLRARGALRRRSRAAEAFGVPALAPRPLRIPADRTAGAPPLDAWLLLPAPPRGVSLPLVLYMGGGPGGMRSDNFIFELQLFAHAGYAVLWVNARGCQGYGDAFCTAILGSWGGADFDDALRALDTALLAHPELDPARVAVAGGSYGGYQVNWAIGHSDRFRAAIADRSVSDRVSSFGSSDIGFLRTFEFDGGTPWETPEAYLRQSPLNGLAGVRTPTLVIHCALDYRCPVEQGEQLYMALKVEGVPAELVRFPNESHGLSRGGRPWHRIYRLEAYLEWFERWLGAGEKARGG